MTAGQYRHGVASAVRLLGPPAIWASHFSALYASQTVFCAWAEREVSAVFIVAVSVAAAALLLRLIWTPLRAGEAGKTTGFVDLAGCALALLSLLAVGWMTVPTLMLPSCTPPV